MPKGYKSVIIGAARGCGFKGSSDCTLVFLCIFDAYYKIIEATKIYNDSVQISTVQ